MTSDTNTKSDSAARLPRQRLRATQRERLLEAAVAIVSRNGYAASTVAIIISEARVSRPTFYEYFKDFDACLLAALGAINETLAVDAAAAMDHADPSRAAIAVADAVIDFCHAEPTAARVWLIESLAGAPGTLDARDDGIDALGRLIDQAHESASPDAVVPDIGGSVIVGGLYRLLGTNLRQGEPMAMIRHGVHQWIESYGVPSRATRWTKLSSSYDADGDATPSKEPPFGARPGHRSVMSFPERDPSEYHRDRIFFAAAQLTATKRPDEIALADIAKQAGVGYRRLIALFQSKEGIFAGLHQLGYLRTLAATFGGYLSRDSWPDRVWAAGDAYTRYVGGNPALARVGFLVPYAAGPRSARHMDQVLKAFTVFIQEGYSYVPRTEAPPSDVVPMAIAATIFDMGYRKCRADKSAELPALLPQAFYVAVAPFLGPEEAGGLIKTKLAEQQTAAA